MPAVAVLAIAAGCALAAPAASAGSDCAGAETRAGEQTPEAVERSLLCLVNERRAAAGSGLLRTNPKLAAAASKHSNEMVANGYFAHSSPGGNTFIDRITATGYMRGARSWLVGENLVWGSGELSTPASMVEAWMKSPPHRANLLRDRFREVGLAAARGTPRDAGDRAGITVSSDYGYRTLRKRANRTRKSGRGGARRG